MAHIVTCDSCGKNLDYKNDKIYYLTIRTSGENNRIYDFCADCYRVYVAPMFKEKGEKDED